MTVPIDLAASGAPAARQARFAAAVAGVRRRAGSVPIDRWLQVMGGVFLPLGLVLVLLGWFGAAHTTRLYEQVPYVVSGGLLGIALVIVGGFCYFAYWLTTIVLDGRAQAAEAQVAAESAAASLGRIEELLRRMAPAQSSAGTATLVATATGALVHLPSCPVVAGKEGLRNVQADEPGWRPCRICEPSLS